MSVQQDNLELQDCMLLPAGTVTIEQYKQWLESNGTDQRLCVACENHGNAAWGFPLKQEFQETRWVVAWTCHSCYEVIPLQMGQQEKMAE